MRDGKTLREKKHPRSERHTHTCTLHLTRVHHTHLQLHPEQAFKFSTILKIYVCGLPMTYNSNNCIDIRLYAGGAMEGDGYTHNTSANIDINKYLQLPSA